MNTAGRHEVGVLESAALEKIRDIILAQKSEGRLYFQKFL